MSKRLAVPIRTWRKQWRDADASQRRQLITEVALHLLDRQGLESVTVRRVASDLGVGAMTLYTYFKGQEELFLAMTRRGFELMREQCQAGASGQCVVNSLDGARRYLQFALKRPRLYGLMFSHPMAYSRRNKQSLNEEFQPFLERVRDELMKQGISGPQLDQMARRAAGRHWIGLHGLASLAIAGRLDVLDTKLDDLLTDLMARCAFDLPSTSP